MKRLSFAASIATSFILLTTAASSNAHAMGDSSNDSSAPYAVMIAKSARGVASSMRSVGYCYRGVKRALRKVGVTLEGGEAYMAKRQLDNSERFTRVHIKDLQVGDILVHGASKRHPHGHIAVYLGNGKEASDHIGRLITGARYGGTTVFRAVPEVEIAEAVPEVAPAVAAVVAPALVPAVNLQPAVAANEQPIAVSADFTPEEKKQPIDLSAQLSTALLKVVEIAQSAQINIGQALADAVGALTS